jgi:hypothetical protein
MQQSSYVSSNLLQELDLARCCQRAFFAKILVLSTYCETGKRSKDSNGVAILPDAGKSWISEILLAKADLRLHGHVHGTFN